MPATSLARAKVSTGRSPNFDAYAPLTVTHPNDSHQELNKGEFANKNPDALPTVSIKRLKISAGLDSWPRGAGRQNYKASLARLVQLKVSCL